MRKPVSLIGARTRARSRGPARGAPREPMALRWGITAVALGFLGLFIVAPLVIVFAQALEKGLGAYVAALRETDAVSAVRLTLLVAGIVVPLNALFGITAAWAIAKFEFRGRDALVTLMDLPLSVSPVISGMIFVLLFGRSGFLGPWLTEHGVQIIFSPPGIVLATLFITVPLVAREVIPVMQSCGTEEEEAARLLGAGGAAIFRRVTLPSIKWGLLYGAILCTARAMGEFGAVSVVSGHIRGRTNTVPLHVEILYNEYRFQAAFAVASLLVLLAVATLVARSLVERHTRQRIEASAPAGARETGP